MSRNVSGTADFAEQFENTQTTTVEKSSNWSKKGGRDVVSVQMAKSEDYSDAITHPRNHDEFKAIHWFSDGEERAWAPEDWDDWEQFSKEFEISGEEVHGQAYDRFKTVLNSEEDAGPNTLHVEATIDWLCQEQELSMIPKAWEGAGPVEDECETCGGGGLIFEEGPGYLDCQDCNGTGATLTETYERTYGPFAEEDDFGEAVIYALKLGTRLAVDEYGSLSGGTAMKLYAAASSQTNGGQDLQRLVDEVMHLYAQRVRREAREKAREQADEDEDIEIDEAKVEEAVEEMDTKVRHKMVSMSA